MKDLDATASRGTTLPHFGILLRAITTSWMAVVANAAVGFFLTPFILHRLGDEAYGLWVLVTTVVGYYGLFDIGLRASILRYVSRQKALGNQKGINEVVGTAFYFYAGVCVVVVLTACLVSSFLPYFFSVRSDLERPFRLLFIFAGVVQGVTFPLEVFGSSLQAAARYDQVYLVRIGSLGLRAVLVVVALHRGAGLFGTGVACILPNVVSSVANLPLAARAIPGMSLHPKWIRKRVLCDMLRYGSISFSVGIGERVRDYIYPVIIARFLAPAAVTLFALPMKLLAFPVQGIGTMTEIVNPISSQLEAHNDFATLRRLIQHSVQGAFLLLLPMAAFLFVFGKGLISVWVGPQYLAAYPILVFLTIGMGIAATQCCVQSMLFGIERHKQLLWYRLAEGLAIACIGSFALRVSGVEALAAVSAATFLVTSLGLVPRYLCRILGLPLRAYLKEAYLKPFLLAIPLTGILVAIHSTLAVTSWSSLALALILTSAVYVLILSATVYANLQWPSNWLSIGVLEALEHRFANFRRIRTQTPLTAERAA